MLLLTILWSHAQNTKSDTITVIKGGITMIKFEAEVTSYKLTDLDNFNVSIEEPDVIRIWPKIRIANPHATTLFVTTGKRNYTFTILYQEQGNHQSTYYDYSDKAEPAKNLNAGFVPAHEQLTAKSISDSSEKKVRAQTMADPEMERLKILKKKMDARIFESTKDQQELNSKLAAEKKQQQSLQQHLNAQRAKMDVNQKTATSEKHQASQQELTRRFPLINFKEPPLGQFYDSAYFADTTVFYSTSQSYLVQEEDPELTPAFTGIDHIRIQLCNINIKEEVAYVRIKIENKTNTYFLLGATMLKILDNISGKSYQLNPYYISSFPVLEANTSAYVVYVMKAETNISPDSFVMLTMKDRQSNARYELNFSGKLYTEALKKEK